MKIKRVDLDEDEKPKMVLVELSHDEAAYLALLLDDRDTVAKEQLVPNGPTLGAAVYECLTYGLFNRYYEDGIKGAAATMRRRT